MKMTNKTQDELINHHFSFFYQKQMMNDLQLPRSKRYLMDICKAVKTLKNIGVEKDIENNIDTHIDTDVEKDIEYGRSNNEKNIAI